MHDTFRTKTRRELVRVLFRNWFLIAFTVLVVAGGTLVYSKAVAKPIYRSHVTLMFKQPVNDSRISTDSPERALEVFVKAQQQIVMSDLVLARALVIAEDPNLRKQWEQLKGRLQAVTAKREGDVSAINGEIDRFLSAKTAENVAGTVPNRVRSMLEGDQEELKKFAKSVELETPGGERVALTESFTILVDRPASSDRDDGHLDAKRAADLVADMYMVRHRQLQQALSDPAIRVMSTVVHEIGNEVEQRRSAYEQFVEANAADIGVLEQLLKSGTEHGIQILLTRIREADAKLHLDLARTRALRNVILADLPAPALEADGVDAMSDEEVAAATANDIAAELLKDNAALLSLREKLAQLEAQRAKLASKFIPESRNIRYLDEEASRLKRELLRTLVAHANGLNVTIRAYEEQQAKNREMLASTAAQQNAITRKLTQYIRLKNDLEIAQKQLDDLREQRIAAEANSLRAREAITISTLDEASTPDPDRPVAPRPFLYTLIALVVSLIMGTGLAFLTDHYDHTLRSSDEAERYLGVPVVGTVKRYGGGLVTA